MAFSLCSGDDELLTVFTALKKLKVPANLAPVALEGGGAGEVMGRSSGFSLTEPRTTARPVVCSVGRPTAASFCSKCVVRGSISSMESGHSEFPLLLVVGFSRSA